MTPFCRNSDGATAVFFALALVPLGLAVGAAVDYSTASGTRARLQKAADASALLGVQLVLKGEPVGRAKATARNSFVESLTAGDRSLVQTVDVDVTPAVASKVFVEALRPASMISGQFAPRISVLSRAETPRRLPDGEVALVLDRTGSLL